MADWTKTINVDKNIVSLLSQATYTDIYQVIREFVNNSYDADATRVDVNIDDKGYNFIEIIDNGKGMTEEEFENNFLTIARTAKNIYSTTKFGRPVVGKFGVGYLSATRFCKQLKIESTTKGSQEVFEATIDCTQFFKPGKMLVWEIPVRGRTGRVPSKEEEGYTKIILNQLTNEAVSFFKKRRETIRHLRSSIKGWNSFESLKWKLQQILPLEYHKKELEKEYCKFLDSDFGKTMEVYLNGEQLFRNPLKGGILFKGQEEIGDNIKFKYVITTSWETVRPTEKVGLQTRLHNVGIGLPDLFGASFLTGHLFVTTRWICGEIQILSGLEDDISINRNGFNDSDQYIEFFNLIHKKVYKSLDYAEKNKPSTRKLGGIEREVGSMKNALINIDNYEEKPILIKKVLKESKETSSSYVDKIYDKLGKDGIYNVELVEYTGDLNQEPLRLDKGKKKIQIVKSHPALKEHVFIKNKGFTVDYEKWETNKEILQDPINMSCKIDIKQNKIILNRDFLLFQDKQYKDIYKELFAILAYMWQKYPNNSNIYNTIAEIIISNYLGRKG